MSFTYPNMFMIKRAVNEAIRLTAVSCAESLADTSAKFPLSA